MTIALYVQCNNNLILLRTRKAAHGWMCSAYRHGHDLYRPAHTQTVGSVLGSIPRITCVLWGPLIPQCVTWMSWEWTGYEATVKHFRPCGVYKSTCKEWNKMRKKVTSDFWFSLLILIYYTIYSLLCASTFNHNVCCRHFTCAFFNHLYHTDQITRNVHPVW